MATNETSQVQRVTIRGVNTVDFIHIDQDAKMHLGRMSSTTTLCGQEYGGAKYRILNKRWFTTEDTCPYCVEQAPRCVVLTPYTINDRLHDWEEAARLMNLLMEPYQEESK